MNTDQFNAGLLNYAYLLPLISKDMEEISRVWMEYHMRDVFPHITCLLTGNVFGDIVWKCSGKSVVFVPIVESGRVMFVPPGTFKRLESFILAMYVYNDKVLYFPSLYLREVVKDLEFPEFSVFSDDYEKYAYESLRPLLLTGRQMHALLKGCSIIC